MAAEVKKEIQLEIAHVLFTDIVGYSKLPIHQQRAFVERLNEIVRSTDEFQAAETAGRLITIPTGDGVTLVFYHSPEAPVECALEISRALKQHPEVQLRMGIHSGPVSGVIDATGKANVAGAGINIAQRVMDCGDSGHILLSKHVAEDLEEYPHWHPYLHELGECEVKHGVRVSVVNLYTAELGNPAVPEKLKAARIAAAARRKRAAFRWLAVGVVSLLAVMGFFVFRNRRPLTAVELAVPKKSIAVMPFENRSEDKTNAYFADGIQDEILTRLSKIADLKVISRTSTQHYKSAPENLSEIGRQLGVAHILEGRVQKSGDAVRVNVQLIKAANDSHLWADTFDRKLTDIFSVESEVAKAIADQLQAKLTGEEEKVISAKPTENLEAYDAYLRGLAYTIKPATPANSLPAQKYLREAVRSDPNFALAWALLSYVESRGYLTQTLQPTAALREEARQAAETALALQPNLGEAVWAKGMYHYACLKDYDTAERYFEQARPLLPNNSRIPQSLAYVTSRRGQWDRSESYFNEAERLDPRNVDLIGQHALYYMGMRRFSEALRKLDQVLNITPDDVDILAIKAAIAQAEGDLQGASALLAPLRPGVDLSQALETQVYQAILERRSAPVIPRLKKILARPDPTFGYLNGELRFWLGWAQKVTGDDAAAQESWRQARSELESFLKEQPQNWQLICDLALTNMALGDKTAALSQAQAAMAQCRFRRMLWLLPGRLRSSRG
jgi:TolB-like protein/class 3 adenylate cyclase/Tfp pilus assembly protein PilF